MISLKPVDLSRDWYGRIETEILKGNKILEICDLLRYYAAGSGNSFPTFGENVSVPTSKVSKSKMISEFAGFLGP